MDRYDEGQERDDGAGDGREGGEDLEGVDGAVAEAYDAGVAAAQFAAEDDAVLTEAAEELEARFTELGDETVQDALFAAMDRAGIDPGSSDGLAYVERYAQRRFLDRADDGDRIVGVATRSRFRLGQ